MNTALGQLYRLAPANPSDDDFDFDFDDSLFDAAASEILDAGGYTPDYLVTPTGSALIGETFRAFDQAISKGLGESPDPAVAAALRENAFVFSGFKTHAEMEQVAALITDEKGNIRPFNEFLNDVKQLNQDYNHRYLRTEYNQAVQSAQMASKWADFERDKAHINLQYRTANDERVRASHRVLHGVTLPVDDKFWEQYTPPNGWGCRCTVVAVPKDDPDFPVRDAQGSTINGKEVFPTPAYEIFKTNTAKAKKVFPDKHPYLPKGCGNCGKTLLAYNPNSIKCKACSFIKRLLKKEQCKKQKDYETILKPLRDFNADSDKIGFRRHKKNEEKAIKQQGSFSASTKNYYTGKLYMGIDDIESLMYHCHNSLEVEAVTNIHNILSAIKNGKRLPLNKKRPNYQQKVNKGYLYIVRYEVEYRGVAFVLKCKVLKDAKGKITEFPYSLKEED